MNAIRRTAARIFWYSAAVVIIYNGLFLSWLLLKPGSRSLFVLSDDLGQAASCLLGATLCFAALTWQTWSMRSATARRPLSNTRLALLFFGIGSLSQGLGQAIYTYYEYTFHQLPPLPSWANLFFLASYPFLLLGVLHVTGRRLTALTHTRIFIDSLMIMTAVATVSWYFILGPDILSHQGTTLARIVEGAYPFSDLVLVFSLLLLYWRSHKDRRGPALSLLSLALLIIVATNSTYAYQSLHNTFATGSLVDLGWPLGYTLIGLAMLALVSLKTTNAHPLPTIDTPSSAPPVGKTAIWLRTSLWRSFLPYIFVLFALVLAIVTNGPGALERGVYLGGTILIGLVVLRQILSLRETKKSSQELRQTHTALQIRNHMLNEMNHRLESLATIDPLTGLPNHGALLEQLHKEFERASRYHYPLSLCFFDGDRFKRINDTYGHIVGDTVLRELGERIQASLRAGDTLGRYGGEEFMVILPETSSEAAFTIAERMRASVSAQPFALEHTPNNITMTISIGIATYPLEVGSSNELIEKADQAMYWAKRLGRNQIRTSSEALNASLDASLTATVHALERYGESRLNSLSNELHLQGDQLSIVYALMWLSDLRDHHMSTHAYQVSDLATAIAQEMGLEQDTVITVATAALLHDIGKIAIPDTLLYKKEKLTEQDWALIKKHPEHSVQMLDINPALHELLPAIRHHHERWDGNGYPDQLAGENIPLEARIIAVAEAMQTMTADTLYPKQNRTLTAGIAELQRCAGTQFDPDIVAVATTVLLRQQQTETRATSDVLSR